MQATHSNHVRRVAPVRQEQIFTPGIILGTVVLPSHVVSNAAKLADEFFTAAEAEEFSGDAVETYAIPLWARRGGTTWLPDVSKLGFRRSSMPHELVATTGVDPHTDGGGMVLIVVLHNDGLTFSQGRVRHVPAPGDWFIFDDRKSHGIKETAGRASFVGWHIPLVSA